MQATRSILALLLRFRARYAALLLAPYLVPATLDAHLAWRLANGGATS